MTTMTTTTSPCSSAERLSSRRRLTTTSSPSPHWMFPFYKKQHMILLALPLALGTFLSLHQSFLFPDNIPSNTAATSTSLSISLLEEERNRPGFGKMALQHDDDDDLPPKIAWLLSFPNSGTSYTMTMVEQATNRSTATNYGVEVTDTKYPSVPVHAHHPEGPYWEGTSVGRRSAPGKNRFKARIRQLPETFVLTKTHCGGRCVRCGATEYVVSNTTSFLRACARTTARLDKNIRIQAIMDPTRVHKVVHLIRNPFTNIIARFHLEGRNMIQRHDDSDIQNSAARARELLPMNATGFATFCRFLDQDYLYAQEEDAVFLKSNSNPKNLLVLMRKVPCRAEFYKYVQWHNYVGNILASMGTPADVVAEYNQQQQQRSGSIKVLTLYYEHFHANLDVTARQLLDFLNQEQYYNNDTSKIRPFRDLPTYDDHFSAMEREAAKQLIHSMATPWTWERIRHYLE